MVKGYSFTQIRLHWIIALFIVFQLIFGEDMGGAWDQVEETGSADMTAMVWAHIIVGVLVLLLALWRLSLRLSRGAPEAPEGPAAIKLAGHVTHWVLYALMIGAPIGGLLAWYGGVEAAAEIHEASKPAFIILIALHVLGALYHQFVVKDNLLNRMRQPAD